MKVRVAVVETMKILEEVKLICSREFQRTEELGYAMSQLFRQSTHEQILSL